MPSQTAAFQADRDCCCPVRQLEIEMLSETENRCCLLQSDLSVLRVRWHSFHEPHSHIVEYHLSVGRCAGCDDLLASSSVALRTGRTGVTGHTLSRQYRPVLTTHTHSADSTGLFSQHTHTQQTVQACSHNTHRLRRQYSLGLAYRMLTFQVQLHVIIFTD